MKHAAASSVAVMCSFIVFSAIGNVGRHHGVYTIVESFSVFQLLKARDIVAGRIGMAVNNGILLFIIAVFIGGGISVFRNKDLPL